LPDYAPTALSDVSIRAAAAPVLPVMHGEVSPAAGVPRDDDASRELRELVAQAARGDAAALRAIYDRLGALAMALALRIVGSRGEAEEVVQEAFLEIWRRAGEYHPARGEARAWVTTIVRSRALDRLRSRTAAARTLAATAREPAGPPPPSPLENAERRRARESVGAALDALPAEQRSALELAYYEGLSHSEIAERTGTPLGTIKTRIKLGVDKLAKLLAAVEDA
jgi:RNA polymerase sigma-70 factor (ECF subfamily)